MALSTRTGQGLSIWLTTVVSIVRGPRHRHLPRRAVWDRTTARSSWIPAQAKNAPTSCVATTRDYSNSVASASAANTVRGPRHRHLPRRAVWDQATARPSWVPARAGNAHTSCAAGTRGCSRTMASFDAATNAPQLSALLTLSGLKPRALLLWCHHDLRGLHQRVRLAVLCPLWISICVIVQNTSRTRQRMHPQRR